MKTVTRIVHGESRDRFIITLECGGQTIKEEILYSRVNAVLFDNSEKWLDNDVTVKSWISGASKTDENYYLRSFMDRYGYKSQLGHWNSWIFSLVGEGQLGMAA